MKKTMVYILAVLALVMALSGCGDNMMDDALHITPRPDVSSMPEVNDGVVNDDNGVITEGDNGPMATPKPTKKPAHTAAPKESTAPAVSATPAP